MCDIGKLGRESVAFVDCPGCGRQVTRKTFVCPRPTCWERLPLELQRKLTSRYPLPGERQVDDITRLLIEGDVRAWFRRNQVVPQKPPKQSLAQQKELYLALGGDPKAWNAAQRQGA